jgi:hypothetical protein
LQRRSAARGLGLIIGAMPPVALTALAMRWSDENLV